MLRRCTLPRRWAAPSRSTRSFSRDLILSRTSSCSSAVGCLNNGPPCFTDCHAVLDTPNNFENSSKDRYHCQIIISWADSKGIPVPDSNPERIALMKTLTNSWSEPFRSLVQKLPDDVEVRSIRIEDWMFEQGRSHSHPRVVLMGDSAHTMTMCE